MKTLQEIVEWYRVQQEDDILGFTGSAILNFVPFDMAKEFLKDDAERYEVPELTEENVLATMREYIEFAWGKVKDHRGISAGRSVEKMKAWLWILGDDYLYQFCENDANYAQYGAPCLKAISEKYGFPIPDSLALKRMCDGLPCTPDCDMGCGKWYTGCDMGCGK